MAVSDSYLTFVLEQLSGVRALVTKRMFGGVGIYSDGTFFAVIDNDTIFFKVDEALARQYIEAGMSPFKPMPDKPAMKSYYQVPPDVLEDGDEMVRWAKQSLALKKEVTKRKAGMAKKEVKQRKAASATKEVKTSRGKR